MENPFYTGAFLDSAVRSAIESAEKEQKEELVRLSGQPSDGSFKRDKSKNTVAFNKMVKKRREKAKHDAKMRKVNRRKK